MAGDTKKKAQQKVKDSATGVEVAVPQPPKRLSAYQIFVQQQRDATKAANPIGELPGDSRNPGQGLE